MLRQKCENKMFSQSKNGGKVFFRGVLRVLKLNYRRWWKKKTQRKAQSGGGWKRSEVGGCR